MFQIPTLELKKHKKVSVVFDEGLQVLSVFKILYLVLQFWNFICIWNSVPGIWNSLFKVSMTLDRIRSTELTG